MIPIVIGSLVTIPKCLVMWLKELEIRGRAEAHVKYNIIDISENTRMSPGNLRSLVVSQIAMKDNKITLA